MADYLGVRKIISNRLDFRDGLSRPAVFSIL